jgi:hypothetical protein
VRTERRAWRGEYVESDRRTWLYSSWDITEKVEGWCLAHVDGVCWRADRAWGSGSRGRGGGGGDFGRPAPCSPWIADRGDGLPWSPRSMGVGVAWPEPGAVHRLSR